MNQGTYGDRIGLAFLDRPTVSRQLDLIRTAERAGYTSAWITETRLARDAISVLGAFAAATERITIGPAVVNTWTRGPALMAVTFATLNEMAPGRVVLGLGAYWDPLAWKQGIERQRPLTQMREYISVVRRLFALEDHVTLEGDTVHVRDISLDLGHGAAREPIPVPIYIGATGEKMMELSGEIADGVLINGVLSTDYTRRAVEHVRRGAERAGRNFSDLDCPQLVNVAMSDDPDEARAVARRFVTMYLGQQPHIGKASGLDPEFLARVNEVMGGWPPRRGGIEDAMQLVSMDIVDRLAVAGKPDHCRGRLREWVDAGASYPIIVPLTENYEEICLELAPGKHAASAVVTGADTGAAAGHS